MLDIDGVAGTPVLPEVDNCLAFRSVMGFPATVCEDQFLISWAVSISSKELKVCSTVILLRSTWSAWWVSN